MEIFEYKPQQWEQAFASERDNLLFNLPQFKFNVEHIGATSINNCRSFRNVDILLSTKNFVDSSTIAMMLESKDYKRLPELSTIDCIVLVKKSKVFGCGITLRVMEYASLTYRRFLAFKTLLRESYARVQKYNEFRKTLFTRVNHDIKKYNEGKINYINNLLEENYKFE